MIDENRVLCIHQAVPSIMNILVHSLGFISGFCICFTLCSYLHYRLSKKAELTRTKRVLEMLSAPVIDVSVHDCPGFSWVGILNGTVRILNVDYKAEDIEHRTNEIKLRRIGP